MLLPQVRFNRADFGWACSATRPRPRWYQQSDAGSGFRHPIDDDLDTGSIHVLNAGSIGQPRDEGMPDPGILRLTLEEADDGLVLAHANFQRFGYDVEAHRQRVRISGLSADTVARLIALFPAPRP